jgi:pimeloyl-ACP methyl ester carboxylesterase
MDQLSHSSTPKGFPALARKLIALEKEPMAWESDVKALKTPVLIIAGGGAMGDMMDMSKRPASRLAIMPATAHTAVITQPDLLHAFIEPFLKGVTPKGMFEP